VDRVQYWLYMHIVPGIVTVASVNASTAPLGRRRLEEDGAALLDGLHVPRVQTPLAPAVDALVLTNVPGHIRRLHMAAAQQVTWGRAETAAAASKLARLTAPRQPTLAGAAGRPQPPGAAALTAAAPSARRARAHTGAPAPASADNAAAAGPRELHGTLAHTAWLGTWAPWEVLEAQVPPALGALFVDTPPFFAPPSGSPHVVESLPASNGLVHILAGGADMDPYADYRMRYPRLNGLGYLRANPSLMIMRALWDLAFPPELAGLLNSVVATMLGT
jgi:hypothetical protein